MKSEKKLRYTHNALRKDAQRDYADCVKDYSTSFEVPAERIDKKYNFTVRKILVKNNLKRLSVFNIIDGNTEDMTIKLS